MDMRGERGQKGDRGRGRTKSEMEKEIGEGGHKGDRGVTKV